jgi:tetratricopeptide (TPR) repeat protein
MWPVRHWFATMLAGALTAMLAIPLVTHWRLRARPRRPVPLREVLAALDAGQTARAVELARVLRQTGVSEGEAAGGPAYVLGVAALRQAEGYLGDERRRHQEMAASYLAEARALGFPRGREAVGSYLLGRTLYELGRYEESRPVLQRALALNPQRRDLSAMLAAALLRSRRPSPREALAHMEKFLAQQQLQPQEREAGQLIMAEIKLALGDTEGARQALTHLADGSPLRHERWLLEAGVLLAEAERQRGAAPGEQASPPQEVVRLCEQALAALALAVGSDNVERPVTAAAEYLQGRCHLLAGRDAEASAVWERTYRRRPQHPAGLAAGFELAELWRRQGRLQAAIEQYRQVLRSMPPAARYENRWLTQEELRGRVVAAYDQLIDSNEFELAIRLVRAARPAFRAARRLELEALAYTSWARAAEGGGGDDAARAASPSGESLAHYRRAGHAWARLAHLERLSREYPNYLWRAAESMVAGHDYQQAARLLRTYLDQQLRARRPTALALLGEAQLVLGHTTQALESLRECMEYFPRDAASFRARWLAALAWSELGQPSRAEFLLLQNVEGDELTPQSVEWRLSLFALGRLLYDQGRFAEARKRLDEAAVRYPNDPHALEARYLAAEACRRQAAILAREAEAEASLDTRLARRQQADRLLEAALDRYEAALSALEAEYSRGLLPAEHRLLLRNCQFARAASLYHLRRYDQALAAYQTALNHHQDSPEVLEAYVQLAACHRRLGQSAQAQAVVAQARLALARLKDDQAFTARTNYTREEWTRLLHLLDRL